VERRTGWSKLPARTIAYAERVENLVAASRSIQPVPAAAAERSPIIAVDDLPPPGHGRLGQSARPVSSNSFALILPSSSLVAVPKIFVAASIELQLAWLGADVSRRGAGNAAEARDAGFNRSSSLILANVSDRIIADE